VDAREREAVRGSITGARATHSSVAGARDQAALGARSHGTEPHGARIGHALARSVGPLIKST
jgi:hypothetical protein